jgi:L-alanine-DL-glutamate epimerase-like enolase superfamily enzyme
MRDTASGTLGRAEERAMVDLAAAVIDAVGDAVDIDAFDCNWRYQVADAQRRAHELEPLGLLWLQDPVPPENVAALRRVTTPTSTPIATGQNGYLRHSFHEALESGAIDIAAPDLQKTGELLEGRRIADYADTTTSRSPRTPSRAHIPQGHRSSRPGDRAWPVASAASRF